MGHVSGQFLDDCFQILARRHIDLAELTCGLPLSPDDLTNSHPVIEWDLFVAILERVEKHVGGNEGLERLGEAVTELTMGSVLRRVAGLAASPRALYAAAERWAIPRYLPILESRIDHLEDGTITIIARIPGSHRGCPQIFHLGTGALRALPQILALPRAEVIAEVRDRWSEWTIIPPPSRSLMTRAYQMTRALFSARAAIEQLDRQQRELEESYRKLHAAYAELEENESRYRALTESAVDLIVELAPDGVLRYVNPSCEELLGLRKRDASEVNLLDWVNPEDNDIVTSYLSDAFAFKARWVERPTFRLKKLDAGWIWVEMEARIYKTRTGEHCAVAILRDVSQRVALEERERRYRENLEARAAERTIELERKNRELRQLQSLLLDAERLDTARDLAGRVAHSINNPLGALMGQISLMIHEGSKPDPRLHHLMSLTRRVGEVVHRTLDLYREGKINRAPESMDRILRELQESVSKRAEENGVEITAHVDQTIPELLVDRPLLLAALENMAENALDWLPAGGHLNFEAELDAPRRRIRIRVEDDGPGVPDENKERIFEPFFTTKPNGTGLGLAIAKGVVKGHEGEIRVEDRPVGGACFITELPLFSDRPASGLD